MRFVVLIYGSETEDAKLGEAEMTALLGEYFAYDETLKAAGALVVGEALEPTAATTTVRVRDGKTVRGAGASQQAGEQLLGLYVIDAADREQAVEYAAKCPGARRGAIEVRAVLEFPAQ